MAQDRIEFVDTISPTAGIRLSLSVEPWRVLFQGTDTPPPPFRRASATTLLVDGTAFPAAAYDNRTLRIHVQLRSKVPETLAVQIQRLHRELNRVSNFIRWQPEPGIQPVYFKTYRAPEYVDSVDYGIGLYEAFLEIPAEPFAYGHRVDVGSFTINNDPTNGTNGKFFDITGVQGDIETPLLIKGVGSELAFRQTAFGIRRRGTPSSMPLYIQAETFTLSTDAALAANSATWSGAGSNSVTINPTTTTAMVERLTLGLGLFPAAANVNNRGVYRVFARVKANTSGVWTMLLQHGQVPIQNPVSAQIAYSSLTNQPGMVDLGLVQIPEGFDPVVEGPTGTEIAPTGIGLAIHASRLSGSGTLSIDYLMFVPADDRFCLVNWGSIVIPYPDKIVMDGYTRSVYGIDSSGNIIDVVELPYIVGDFLAVSPGVTNRIVTIRGVGADPEGFPDGVTASFTLTVSYWPRYLTVRPVSS